MGKRTDRLTYEADDGTALPALADLPGVATLEEAPTSETATEYFDTTDLALAAAGISLCRTTGGEDPGWRLDLPLDDAVHTVRLPLGRAVRTVPAKLRRTVRTVTAGRTMAAVATARTTRAEHRLLDDEGRVLATLRDDRTVAVRTVDGGSVRRRTWASLAGGEVEGSVVAAVGEQMRVAGARPAAGHSTYELLLGDLLTDRAPRPPPRAKKATAAQVVQARLAALAHEVRALDPLVRCDAPDAVHRMRVATRRMRSALATFRPMLDPEVTEPLREELKWLGGALGDVRDTEVMHRRLARMVADEPSVLGHGRAREQIDRELDVRYTEAREEALAAMGSDRYLTLLDRLDRLAASPPWTAAADRRARDLLPSRLRRDWRRLERRYVAAAAASDRDERARRLHETRKAAKRLRYAAETSAPVFGKDARRLVKRAKRVQSALGDHHDTVVTRAWLRDAAERAAAAQEDAFTFGVLHAREEQAAESAEARLAEAWRKTARKKRRRWFG